MKNEKVENQKMEDVYNKEYLPSIVRVGRFVLLASTLFFFAPFLYTWIGWGVTPDWPAIVKGTFAWLLINLPWWISEPVAYFPVQGVTGMLLCSLAGNASKYAYALRHNSPESSRGGPGDPKRFADFHHCHLHNMLCQHWYTGCSGLCGAGCIKPASGVCIQWTEPSAPGAVRVYLCPIFVWK